MSISCYCGDGDYDWFYDEPKDFVPLETKRRQRCYSCRELIDLGADVGKFNAWRSPRSDIEERIYGEDGDVAMADFYMCETCTGLFWAIRELGYCVSLTKGESMRYLAALTKHGGE